MAARSPLRRWKPFFASFGLVDAAIEAAGGPPISRDAFRSARGEVVELLCDVPAGGECDADAEELCAVLDGFMAESLVTLRSVPASAVPRVLGSVAGLAEAVGALRCHESERVRGLARDVVRGWRAAVEDDIVRVTEAVEKLDRATSQLLPSTSMVSPPVLSAGRLGGNNVVIQKSQPPCAMKTTAPAMLSPGPAKAAEASRPLPKKTSPAPARSDRTSTSEKAKASAAKIPESLAHMRTPPVTGRAIRCSPEEKIEATKRKLHQGYQEAEDAKRQRKIQVIEAPKMVEQRQRKMHPILRERSRARCGTSTAVRRSLLPSLHRM